MVRERGGEHVEVKVNMLGILKEEMEKVGV